MKKLFILVFVSIAFMANGQDLKEKLIGNWWYCGGLGYNEYLFTDSTWTIYFTDLEMVIFYKYWVEDNVIYFYRGDDLEFIDTANFYFTENNQLVLTSFKYEYVCEKIEEEINTWEDYSCEMGIGRNIYQIILETEFIARATKRYHDCPKEVDFPFFMESGPLMDKDEFDKDNGIVDDEYENYKSKYVGVILEKMFFVEKNIDSAFDAKIYSIEYNKDSTQALVTVDYGGKCYDGYNVFSSAVYNREEKTLDLEINVRNYECSELCHMRFIFLYILEDCEFDEMTFHFKDYKIRE